RGIFDAWKRIEGHPAKHGEAEEAMRDRAAERRRPGALRIDMNELAIERRVGEGVDARLIDIDPGRDPDLLSYKGAIAVDRHVAGFRHGSQNLNSPAAPSRHRRTW